MKRLLFLAFAVLILATLAVRPLWVDELHQLLGTRGSTAALLKWSLSGPGGAPLAYLAQQWVLAALGFSAFTARLAAALFGIGSAAVFYSLARRWQVRHALAATVLFAFLPAVFRYAQEARPYSQALFFALLMLYAWPGQPVLLGVACLLGLYTQPFTVFPALALLALSVYRRHWPNAAALALAMAAFLPWLWIARTTAAQAHTMDQFFFSWRQVTPQMILRELAGGTYWVTVPLLILAVLGYRGLSGEHRRLSVLWLAFSLLGPILADAAAGYFFASRQLIFMLPVLVLMAAEAATPSLLVGGLATALLVASIVRDVRYPFSAKEDWAAAAHELQEQLSRQPDACLLVAPPLSVQYFAVFAPSVASRACAQPLTAPVVLSVQTPYTTPAERQELSREVDSQYHSVHSQTSGGALIQILHRNSATP